MFSMKSLGGRKFTLVMIALLITSILTYLGILKEDTYQAVLFMLVGSYLTGNVAQHYVSVSTANGTITSKTESTTDNKDG